MIVLFDFGKNKRNNHTNSNVFEVVRKCDNVYGQKSPLQMYIGRNSELKRFIILINDHIETDTGLTLE